MRKLRIYVGPFLVIITFLVGWFVREKTFYSKHIYLNVVSDLHSNLSHSHPENALAANPLEVSNHLNKKLPPQMHFSLEEITEEIGLTFEHEDPVLDFKTMQDRKYRLFFVAGGVAVADFNKDGWMDIFLVTSKQNSKNHLYLNNQGKNFKEVAQAWGIDDTNQDGATITPIIFDYNNDGFPDVYLATLGCSKLFQNTGKRFENVSIKVGVGDCKNSSSAVPLDFNNDGKLDLYVLRYWPDLDYFHLSTPFIFIENNYNPKNGGKNTLYINQGNTTFADHTPEFGGADDHWSLDAGWADFYGDGNPMLYISNDWGPDVVYAKSQEKLVDISDFVFSRPDRRNGMGVTIGDLDHDGIPHIHVSNVYTPHYSQLGNFLWKFHPEKGVKDESIERNSADCGWAWGAAFADFDLDGEQDLYVTNGFITGRVPQEYHFQVAVTSSIPGALFRDFRAWPPLGDRSFSGNQIDCVFMNRGRTFENITPRLKDIQKWDGRGVGMIDFDNNGAMDLIVSTQTGKPHFLKNTVNVGNQWIGFQLIGTRSNRDAVGAKIKVMQGERVWYRWATGGKTGFLTSSDPRLHVGLLTQQPVSVEVRWPSGSVKTYHDISPGRYHTIVEDKN